MAKRETPAARGMKGSDSKACIPVTGGTTELMRCSKRLKCGEVHSNVGGRAMAAAVAALAPRAMVMNPAPDAAQARGLWMGRGGGGGLGFALGGSGGGGGGASTIVLREGVAVPEMAATVKPTEAVEAVEAAGSSAGKSQHTTRNIRSTRAAARRWLYSLLCEWRESGS